MAEPMTIAEINEALKKLRGMQEALFAVDAAMKEPRNG